MSTPFGKIDAKKVAGRRASGATTRKRRLFLEQLEDRRVLSSIVWLNSGGVDDVAYRGPVYVDGIDVPPFSATGLALGGREPEIMLGVRDNLIQQGCDPKRCQLATTC